MSGIKNLHILVGSLETAQASYWYYCQPLPSASNSNNIAQAVNDTVRYLGINRNSLLSFIV